MLTLEGYTVNYYTPEPGDECVEDSKFQVSPSKPTQAFQVNREGSLQCRRVRELNLNSTGVNSNDGCFAKELILGKI